MQQSIFSLLPGLILTSLSAFMLALLGVKKGNFVWAVATLLPLGGGMWLLFQQMPPSDTHVVILILFAGVMSAYLGSLIHKMRERKMLPQAQPKISRYGVQFLVLALVSLAVMCWVIIYTMNFILRIL